MSKKAKKKQKNSFSFQLSTRELILVFILIELCLNVFGIRVLYVKSKDRLKEIVSENEQLEISYQSDSILANNYVDIKKNFILAQKELQENQANVYPYTNYVDLNQYVAESILSSIKVNSITMEKVETEYTYIDAYSVHVTTSASLNEVMDVIYKIQNLEYVAYVDNFSIGEKNSSFSFVIYVH